MSAVSTRVLDEAITWQLRLDADANPEQRQAFATWLAADAQHRRVWEQLAGLDQHLASAQPAPLRRALLQVSRPRRRLRSLLTVVLAAGLLMGLLQHPQPWDDYWADQRTGAGQQLSLTLPDRSLLHLNSRSAVDIDFTADQRRLTLRHGEILVQTAHGDRRPFLVQTAEGVLRPLGTRFLVRRDGDSTQLIVLQAAVAARPQAAIEERVINAGQQLRMQRDGLTPTQSAPLAADAWSRGMLVADDMLLPELLKRLDEYRPGYLGLDASLADLRISGSFPLHDSDRALAALPPSLPVRIESYGRWWTRVVPR